MAGSKPEQHYDFIGANIKVFKSNNDTKTDLWSWPPKTEIMEFTNQFLPTSVPPIKTCFSLDKMPSAVPDAEGNKHVVAAHCLIYAPTHDLWKGCAMVSKCNYIINDCTS